MLQVSPLCVPLIHQNETTMKTNTRNANGVKDSANCYMTIESKQWNQITDFRNYREDNSVSDLTKENAKDEIAELQKEYPNMEFKCRKISGKYRIYGAQK